MNNQAFQPEDANEPKDGSSKDEAVKRPLSKTESLTANSAMITGSKPQTNKNSKPNQKPSEESDDKDLMTTAYHEAGHAVMAAIVGRPIYKVTVNAKNLSGGGFSLGTCKFEKGRKKPTKDWLEDEVLILFAGMVAESHFTQQYCKHGAAQDLRAIGQLLSQSRATTERKLEKLHRRLLEKTEYLLADPENEKAVEMVAQELIEKRTISGRAVLHLLNQAQRK